MAENAPSMSLKLSVSKGSLTKHNFRSILMPFLIVSPTLSINKKTDFILEKRYNNKI